MGNFKDEVVENTVQLFIDDKLRVTKVNTSNPIETQEMGIEVGELLRQSNPFIFHSVMPYLKPAKKKENLSDKKQITHLASLSPDDTQGLAKIDIWSKDDNSSKQQYMLEIEPAQARSACHSCDLKRDEIHRLRSIAQWTKLGILQLNEQWDVTYSNHAFHELCEQENHGMKGQDWLFAVHLNDREELIGKLRHSMQEKSRCEVELRLKTPLGSTIWVNVQCSPIYDFTNTFMGFVLIFLNINSKHIAEEQLLELAMIDSLTGLYNRHAFIEKVIYAFSMLRDQHNFAIMYIDLDGFKAINDALGHASGDRLLNHVANRLKENVRNNDVVARLGGDEFAILLHNVSGMRNVEYIALKLLDVISSPYYLDDDDKESFVSASIGITLAESINEKIDYKDKEQLRNITDQLLQCADQAMYRAKHAGRNTFRFHEHLLDAESKKLMSLSNALHHALENNEFELHYQPQYDHAGKKIYGYEALLRWVHPEYGYLGPEAYLPVIERSGMVHDIGKWIIVQAIQDHASYIEATGNREIRLSINISATQFRDPELIPTFQRLLDDFQIPAETITVEITETVLMDSYLEIQKDLEAMVNMGLSIALDDFGCGYSSLTYLQQFPIEIIKIDQSFVQNIDKYNSKMITQAIITLAQSLNKKVVAEGVETESQFNTLLDAGCQLFQGWYFDKAKPINQIIKGTKIH